MDTFLIVMFILISCVIAIGWYGLRKICPSCKKWNGLQTISSEHQRTETRYRTQTETIVHKDSSGRVTGTTEKPIQKAYNVNFYTITFECSHCHHKTQRILRNGKYLKESGIIFLVCLALIYSSFNKNEADKNIQNSDMKVTESTSDVSGYSDEDITKSTDNYGVTKVPDSEKVDEIVDSSKNDESTTNNEIVMGESSFVITKDSPDDLKVQLAKDLLKQGLSIKIIADSSFLSRAKIRKLKRTLE